MVIHIDTIYESEAFRLLAQGMKDKDAVGICFALMSQDEKAFRFFDDWCHEALREKEDERALEEARQAEATKKYIIGDIMSELVFKQNGITDLHDLQRVLDVTEKLLAETSCRLANEMHAHNLTKKEFEQQEIHNKEAIGRRDDRITKLSGQLHQARSDGDAFVTTSNQYQTRVRTVHDRLFHDDPTDVRERYARLLEEVLELGQALNIPSNEIPKLVERVYARERGNVNQELGGVAMTFGSLCQFLGRNLFDVAFDGLAELEDPVIIEKVRNKRKTRHGRGLLPGFDATEARTLYRSQASATLSEDRKAVGVTDVLRAMGGREMTGGVHEPDTRPLAMHHDTAHALYKTGDADAPNEVQDRNGEVVLAMCRKCGKAEIELDHPCAPVAYTIERPEGFRWDIGKPVQKVKGSKWRGYVVGFYRTSLNGEGYAVESQYEPGNVQVYPVAALEGRFTDD